MMKMKKNAQSLIEYGLILALVAVVAVTILGKFSTSISTVGNQANSAMSGAGQNAVCEYCKQTADPVKCAQNAGITCP